MDSKLDIFRRLPGGQSVWICAVDSLEEAQREVRRLADANAGDYFVYDAARGCQVYSISGSPDKNPDDAESPNLE